MSRHSQLAKALMVLLSGLAALVPAAAEAKKDVILYSFPGGKRGAGPGGGVIQDAQGNFYGTTVAGGGTNETACGSAGCGTVYKLAPDGTETVLHKFHGGSDGALPYSLLVFDSAGNMYGTTFKGGAPPIGPGVIFEVSSTGKERVVHVFNGGSEGGGPQAGLVIDSAGNLYGTAEVGGASGWGTVFKFTPHRKFITLYAFMGGSDGAFPAAGLLRDTAGNFYGTTFYGGVNCDGTGLGCGTVYKLTPKGKETVLYAFQGGSDGANAGGGVAMDSRGSLYGTTDFGGVNCDGTGEGCGTVYKLTPKGQETVLHAFQGGSDGANPDLGSLVIDTSGALYGTTTSGGTNCSCGTVFRLSHRGTESILHTFKGGADRGTPEGTLLPDAAGNLYGTTVGGGGIVYEVAR